MRKFTKALFIVAVIFLLGKGGTANADLLALGAVNPATGYPFWYQDNNGRALSLCLDQNGFCLLPAVFVFPDNRNDISAANFPDESFYYSADTSGISPGGTISLGLYEAAVEAGFVTDVVDGGQAVFTRIRIRVDVTVPGTYIVTHPYGVKSFTVASVGAGSEINDTVDVPGLVLAPFDQNHPSLRGIPPILPQNVGPFLTRADGVTLTDPTNPNNRYIGLPGQPVAVTGSPTGNNFVRITGPGADTLQVNTFNLMGKIVGLEITPTGAQNFDVVKTGAAPDPTTTRSFTATNLSGVITEVPVITPPAGYTVAPGTCTEALTATGAGSSCTFTVSFTPLADGAAGGNVTFAAAPSPSVGIAVTGIGDGIPPTLTAGQNVFTKTTTATISGTATDNILVQNIQVLLGGISQGNTSATNGNWSFNVTGLTPNAPNTVTVTAVDSALPAPGNATTLTATVTSDSILPAVNLTAPGNGLLTNNRTPALTFTATDTNLASTIVKVDGNIVTPVPATLASLNDGAHSVSVEATDAAGNLTTATNSFTVDATAPVITVVSPKIFNARVGQRSPALTVSVNDTHPAPANTLITLDGTDVTALATLGPFTAGSSHTLTVSATDGAGNSATTTLPFTIVLSDGRIVSLGAAEPGIADVLLALRHAVNLITLNPDQFAHGNVAPLDANGIPNPDDKVDIADALAILRRVVGLITTF